MLCIIKIIQCNHTVCTDIIQCNHCVSCNTFRSLNLNLIAPRILKNYYHCSGFGSCLSHIYRCNYIFNTINCYLVTNNIFCLCSFFDYNICKNIGTFNRYAVNRVFNTINCYLITSFIRSGISRNKFFFKLSYLKLIIALGNQFLLQLFS